MKVYDPGWCGKIVGLSKALLSVFEKKKKVGKGRGGKVNHFELSVQQFVITIVTDVFPTVLEILY